ncbi:hypothetical protein AACH06_09850 [Ideonella sp. DXS29W]|uniref:Transmembrane protein n=1 Tax=Ideonella lacteola TaxID=2984193 RepID=A0ABU9BMD1_9BURK
MLRLLMRALAWPFKWLLALLILFEEWGWEPLQRGLARIGRSPGLRWIEAWVRRLPPYGALALFALPALALLPIKILALWLIGLGRVVLGTTVILLTKLVGTAVLARLFTLTQPALMQLGWFARAYGRWSRWKQGLLAWVRASAMWRTARFWRLSLRRRWRAQMRRWRPGQPRRASRRQRGADV